METDRLKDCLATSYDRLRELADGDPSVAVPSCPEWTLADLVSHVAHVYLHKVETMRRGQWPDPWPRPMRFFACLAPLGGRRLLKLMIALYLFSDRPSTSLRTALSCRRAAHVLRRAELKEGA